MKLRVLKTVIFLIIDFLRVTFNANYGLDLFCKIFDGNIGRSFGDESSDESRNNTLVKTINVLKKSLAILA